MIPEILSSNPTIGKIFIYINYQLYKQDEQRKKKPVERPSLQIKTCDQYLDNPPLVARPEQPAHARPGLGGPVSDVALVNDHDIGPPVLEHENPPTMTLPKTLLEPLVKCWETDIERLI